jgi:choline dehydrogenase-like flavoprotein
MALTEFAPEYDAVIVGSGIAGAMIADHLAGHGLSVLLLEAGGVPPDSLGRWALMRNFVGSPSKLPDSPFCGDNILAPQPVASAAAKPQDPKTYYERADGTDPFKSFYERAVGGSTWHWQGIYVRMLPNDFRMKDKFGVGVNWPISYETVAPWYARAEKEMGVAGDDREMHAYYARAFKAVNGAPRPLPYPMGALTPSFLDLQVAKAVNGKALDDVEIRVTTVPHAINSHPFDGRPACDGRTSCVPLCPTKARYEAIIHVERAMRKGAVLKTQAVVTRLELAADQKRIARVHFQRWRSNGDKFDRQGDPQSVSGRVIILAANGIENPLILLRSNIATGSDAVGRYLMDHPIRQSLALVPIRLFPFRGPQTTSQFESFRDGAFRSRFAGFKTSIKNDGWASSAAGWPRGGAIPAKGANDKFPATIVDLVENWRYIGKSLREKLEDHATRQLTLNSACEQLPIKENRVTSSTNLDLLGIPRPRIEYRVNNDDYLAGAFKQIVKFHNFVFNALHVAPEDRYFAKEDAPNSLNYAGSGHIMGTTRMGDNPRDSVVDRNCRSHEHPNLFILGSSVFPTGSTANPTSTVAALALRAAAHVVAEARKGKFNA